MIHADDALQCGFDIYNAATDTQVIAAADRYARLCGAQSTAWVLHNPPAHVRSVGGELHHYATHDIEWLTVYGGEEMWRDDPVLQTLPLKTAPFRWSELHGREMTRREADALHSLRAFGMSDGISAPCRGPFDCEGNFAMTYDIGGALTDSDIAALRPTTTMIAAAVHHQMIRLSGLSADSIERVRLTKVEQEILTWTAAGKMSHDVAVIRRCSPDFVRRVLSTVRAKLDVDTTPQAVAKAISLRQISHIPG